MYLWKGLCCYLGIFDSKTLHLTYSNNSTSMAANWYAPSNGILFTSFVPNPINRKPCSSKSGPMCSSNATPRRPHVVYGEWCVLHPLQSRKLLPSASERWVACTGTTSFALIESNENVSTGQHALMTPQIPDTRKTRPCPSGYTMALH